TGLTGGTSASFNVTAAAASHLVFLAQPSTTTTNHAIAPPVQVQFVDQFGNPIGTTASVTIAPNGPVPFDPASVTTVAAVNGVATFSQLILDNAGTYTLTVSAAGVTGATSASFAVVLPPNLRPD